MRWFFQMKVVMVGAAIGCTRPTAPSEGFATVEGQVVSLSGLPVSGTNVAVQCANGAVAASGVTGTTGGYFLVNLTASTTTMGGSNDTNLVCDFGAPDLSSTRFHLETMIRFAAAGGRVPQEVTLRESP